MSSYGSDDGSASESDERPTKSHRTRSPERPSQTAGKLKLLPTSTSPAKPSATEPAVGSLPSPPLSDDDDDGTGAATNRRSSPQCVRQFPHVAGQFATHIYLSARLPPKMQRAIDSVTARLAAGDQPSGVHVIDPAEYHISQSFHRSKTLNP